MSDASSPSNKSRRTTRCFIALPMARRSNYSPADPERRASGWPGLRFASAARSLICHLCLCMRKEPADRPLKAFTRVLLMRRWSSGNSWPYFWARSFIPTGINWCEIVETALKICTKKTRVFAGTDNFLRWAYEDRFLQLLDHYRRADLLIGRWFETRFDRSAARCQRSGVVKCLHPKGVLSCGSADFCQSLHSRATER